MDPLIQLKSKKIVHDINKQTFRYYDVFWNYLAKKYFTYHTSVMHRQALEGNQVF